MAIARTGNKRAWSYSAGERGRNRVRAYEDSKGGLFLEYYERAFGDATATRKRVAVGSSDRNVAKRKADEMAAELARTEPAPHDTLTLQQLFDMYLVEVTPRKDPQSQEHDRACARMFLRFFGADRLPGTLNVRDWNRFIQERSRGTIRPVSGKKHDQEGEQRERPARPVRSRAVAYDLNFVLAVLNWACLAANAYGEGLLDRNPFRGLPLPRERNPRRPILSEEQYRALLAVARTMNPSFELMLIIAHETGHRSQSVRRLRWEDVDLDRAVIRWRAENDKMRLEHSTPLSAEALAALTKAREHAGRGAVWVFPSPGDSSEPCGRDLARVWWRRAAKRAGLPKIPGLGWHSLRRKFATELKDAPLKDLAELGGWRSAATILTCYQQPDEERMKEALARRRPLAVPAG